MAGADGRTGMSGEPENAYLRLAEMLKATAVLSPEFTSRILALASVISATAFERGREMERQIEEDRDSETMRESMDRATDLIAEDAKKVFLSDRNFEDAFIERIPPPCSVDTFTVQRTDTGAWIEARVRMFMHEGTAAKVKAARDA
jgi:hypothetical protein